VAWLFARSQNARFLVRVEDLDPQRSRPQFERSQLEDLAALGLDWDSPPVRQSERGPLYEAALQRLDDAGRLYPCFCTRAEIREAASAPHGDLPEGAYPGTCRELTTDERRRHESEGRPFALRVRAEAERIGFHDLLLGPHTAVVDDFVVRRADGVPAYQLAVVVDDAAQGIKEVVRGADLAGSTPRQILLTRWLNLPTPRYAHVALVLGADGARLAKRHGSVTLAERAEPVASTLEMLARSLNIALPRAPHGAADLLSHFSPEQLTRDPLVINR
jgi:glutamyl-tRNA synthetase